jgi:hypothetical protein
MVIAGNVRVRPLQTVVVSARKRPFGRAVGPGPQSLHGSRRLAGGFDQRVDFRVGGSNWWRGHRRIDCGRRLLGNGEGDRCPVAAHLERDAPSHLIVPTSPISSPTRDSRFGGNHASSRCMVGIPDRSVPNFGIRKLTTSAMLADDPLEKPPERTIQSVCRHVLLRSSALWRRK